MEKATFNHSCLSDDVKKMDEKTRSEKQDILLEVKYVPTEFKNNEKFKAESQNNKKNDTIFLYVSVIAAQMLVAVAGANLVWTSPALIKLYSNDTQINPLRRPIKTVEVSMVAGIPSLLGLAGSFMLPKLSDVIGRKKYLMLIGLGTLIAGVALAFSMEIIYIIISKSLLSFFLSGAWTIIPVFVAEICENHNRAKFGCFLGLFHEIGHCYAYVVGPLFSLKNFTLIITAPALVFLMIFVIVPESPIYLLSKGKEKKCKEALRKFRNNKSEEELEADFVQIKETLKGRAETNKGNVLDLFRKRENRFALLLALLPLLVQSFSGISILMTYLAPVFNAAGTSISGDIVAIIISIVKISSFTFTSFVVETFGRKRMLLISATGSGVPLLVLGLYFYLQYINSALLDSMQWLPLFALLSSTLMFSIGLGPVPFALISELFQTDLRAASSAVINTLFNIVMFSLTACFPLISEAFGIHCCIWLFSSCSFLGAILIYFFLPELKGKSFTEIQEMLKMY
ncbi:unnamed protein product [Psylliodes chrysocephalus]|uniref:Major facilitator superfamily (MFS) profile domain-containing protein n=1 Tax=Psylliodes chrysocephalus TaxID=3402493 RepID=A0A9P0D4B2_9CUCU|nr:unnamed protein product [Psylliodes chrysocephala]